MANEQNPVLIDVTEIFNTYGARTWADKLSGIPRMVNGAAAKCIVFNADNIAKMEDADKSPYSPSPATRIIQKTGGDIFVQETKAQIKEKVAAALNP